MRKIFVGGLPHDATKEDVQEFFARYGEIEEVTIQYDRASGRPRGFCFVIFANESSVDRIVPGMDHVFLDLKGKRVSL